MKGVHVIKKMFEVVGKQEKIGIKNGMELNHISTFMRFFLIPACSLNTKQ